MTPTERTAGVVGQLADGRWWPASVVITELELNVVSVSFFRQLSAVTQCGEQHSRSSSVVSPTAHTARTPSSTSLQSSQHCQSLFNKVWLEKCREIAPPVWTHRRSPDFSSYGSKQVKTGQHCRKTGSVVAQQATAMQPWCAAYAYTGSNGDLYEYICKYVNQWPHWTLQ